VHIGPTVEPEHAQHLDTLPISTQARLSSKHSSNQLFIDALLMASSEIPQLAALYSVYHFFAS
jgi:hypothetical protein